jgi:hypothetical protein
MEQSGTTQFSNRVVTVTGTSAPPSGMVCCKKYFQLVADARVATNYSKNKIKYFFKLYILTHSLIASNFFFSAPTIVFRMVLIPLCTIIFLSKS